MTRNSKYEDLMPAMQLQEWMPGTNLGALWIFREIRVGAEGEVLAVMAKVMCECNVFNICNKAELCRLMCRTFGTRHTTNMSFNNFKNCFDLPGRDPLIYVIEGLTTMIAVANRMLEPRIPGPKPTTVPWRDQV